MWYPRAQAGRYCTGTVGFCGSTPHDSVARKTGSDRAGWRAIVLLRLVPGLRIATVVGCGIFGVPFRLFLPALALGGFGYLVVYTLLGYFVGPEILAIPTQLHG